MAHIPKLENQKTGPLTERQRQILLALTLGEMHAQIARRISEENERVGGHPISRTTVSQDVRYATLKMGAKTSREAVAKYATAAAYDRAAKMLLGGRVPVPVDEAEVHVNHVLEGMAAELSKRAAALIPK